jgi:hypothetical protein
METDNSFALGSRAVSWWSVHEFAASILARVGAFPLLGTPAWCLLDDSDPVKWAALLDAAQHYALRLETDQEQRAEASRDVSAAADWSALASSLHRRELGRNSPAYIPRKRAS